MQETLMGFIVCKKKGTEPHIDLLVLCTAGILVLIRDISATNKATANWFVQHCWDGVAIDSKQFVREQAGAEQAIKSVCLVVLKRPT